MARNTVLEKDRSDLKKSTDVLIKEGDEVIEGAWEDIRKEKREGRSIKHALKEVKKGKAA